MSASCHQSISRFSCIFVYLAYIAGNRSRWGMSSAYNHIKHRLPKEIFRPSWLRLFPVFLVWGLGVGSVVLISVSSFPWYVNLLLSIFIGYCWSICGLFAHEILHGSVIRSKRWQNILTFFCFLPYMISPTFWRYWHNNLHHSHTQKAFYDPDAFPTLRIFKQSRLVQWIFPFTPGSGRKRSFLYFFFWFSLNAQIAQHYSRYRNRIFDKLNHRQVSKEIALAIAVHIAAFVAVGPWNWVWVVLLPFLVMNYLPFSYISTNHNLNGLTKENDPLKNSLTVTNHPILEFLHINFGYHVEHHMFPTLSWVHLKKVHGLLKEEYPHCYLYMPKWKAMCALYKTSRIYKDSKTLIHPVTGKVSAVLTSRKPVIALNTEAVETIVVKSFSPESVGIPSDLHS